MSRCAIFAMTFAAMLTSPLPALAHAHLKAASPAAGATVTSAPVEVVLDFFEAIEPNLTRTAYGWVLLLKLTLFAVLLALAAVNRFRLTPALSRGAPSLEGGH